MSDAYVLARSTALPDKEFSTAAALARELKRLSQAGRPRPRPCRLARGALPGGAAFAVRDEAGGFIGYVLMPRGRAGDALAVLKKALAR